MKFIDPHIHLFDVALGDYGWLKAENQPNWPDKALINRSFDQNDLVVDEPLFLAGFVHIEAGFDNECPWREIAWLENNVTLAFSAIAGVDITLEPAEFKSVINTLIQYKSVVGIRHIFDEEAVEILSHINNFSNLDYLAKKSLIFETQINGADDRCVDAYCNMAESHPGLSLILGHGAFCPLESVSRTRWMRNIHKLGHCPNLVIKASGWEMVSRDYNQQYISDVLSHLLDCFDENRIMLASNFPLVIFSTTYGELWEIYRTSKLSLQVKKKLMYSNALRIYRVNHLCGSDAK